MWTILWAIVSLAVIAAVRVWVFGFAPFVEEAFWNMATAWGGSLIVVVAYFQLSAAREAELKERTLEACMMYDRDPVIVGVRRAVRQAQLSGDLFANPAKYEAEIGDLLNYFDTIAIGIHHKLYLEPLAKEHMGIIILRACRLYLNADFLKRTDPQRTLEGYGCLVDLVARWEKNPPKGVGEARS